MSFTQKSDAVLQIKHQLSSDQNQILKQQNIATITKVHVYFVSEYCSTLINNLYIFQAGIENSNSTQQNKCEWS